jgi:hypothetical protein
MYLCVCITPNKVVVYSLASMAVVRKFSAVDYVDRIEWAGEGMGDDWGKSAGGGANDGDSVLTTPSHVSHGHHAPQAPAAMGLILLTMAKRSTLQVFSIVDSSFQCLITPSNLTTAAFCNTSRHVFAVSDFMGPTTVYALASGRAIVTVNNAKGEATISQPPIDEVSGSNALSVTVREGGHDVAKIYTTITDDGAYRHQTDIPLPTLDVAKTLITASPVSQANLQLIAIDHHVYAKVAVCEIPSMPTMPGTSPARYNGVIKIINLSSVDCLGVRTSMMNPSPLTYSQSSPSYPAGTFVALGQYTNALTVLLTLTNTTPFTFHHTTTPLTTLSKGEVLPTFVGYTETIDGSFLPNEIDIQGLDNIARGFTWSSRGERRRSLVQVLDANNNSNNNNSKNSNSQEDAGLATQGTESSATTFLPSLPPVLPHPQAPVDYSQAVPKTGVSMMSWSPGGGYVATLSAAIPSCIWIWGVAGEGGDGGGRQEEEEGDGTIPSKENNAEPGGGLARILTFRQPVKSFRYSPSTSTLAIACSTSRVYLYSRECGVRYVDLPSVYGGMEVVSVRWGGGGIVAVGRKGAVVLKLEEGGEGDDKGGEVNSTP